jgi:threonine aldolase
MWEAISHAPIGDDCYGEDPSINELEAKTAQLLGKEASVFVPSGTTGNLASILAHCRRGDEIILGDKTHIFWYEQGSIAALGGVQPHLIPNQPDGTLLLEDVEAAIRPDDPHHPRTRVICLENTHNACNGWPLTVEYTRAVREVADAHGLKLHLDGSRIFNAAVAQEVPVSELAAPSDSITFCLSKGLCCPVGSMICGSTEFIQEARRQRKVLGGSLRQAGILAAAGIVALDTMVDRLADDHTNAKRLAEALNKIPGIDIETAHVRTNILFFGLHQEVPLSAQEFAEQLKMLGVLIGQKPNRRFRAVIHYWISAEDINTAAAAFMDVISGK